MMEKEVKVILRIEGGVANDGMLDIYDAANTMNGLARAINIVAHSFANDEEVRSRADCARGSKSYIHASKKGCFEEQVDIFFNKKTIQKIGHSVLANNFWDYLICSWSASIGLQPEPTTPYVNKLLEKDEDFFHVIADALESPMQNLHESIRSDAKIKIFLERPRIGDLIEFNQNSLNFVTLRKEKSGTAYIVGNVTRYNILTDFGRLYSDEEQRVISFRLAHDDPRLRSLSLKSMQEKDFEDGGKLSFKVSEVVSSHGIVKRYVIHDISTTVIKDE